MIKVSASALCASAIVLLSAVQVIAGPPTTRLHGEYYVVGSRTCAYATGFGQDFGPNFSLPINGGTTRTGHYDGVLRLNGDGTGDFTFNFIQYYFQSISAGQLPIGAFPGSCMVLYESLPSGLISLTLTQCVGTGTAGAGNGSTWTNDDEVLTLAATMGGDVVVMSNTEPVVGTTSLNGDSAFAIRRICSRTFTGVRQSIR